jgi:hypothetical protein
MNNIASSSHLAYNNDENKININNKKEFSTNKEKYPSPFFRVPLEDITNRVTDDRIETIRQSSQKNKARIGIMSRDCIGTFPKKITIPLKSEGKNYKLIR